MPASLVASRKADVLAAGKNCGGGCDDDCGDDDCGDDDCGDDDCGDDCGGDCGDDDCGDDDCGDDDCGLEFFGEQSSLATLPKLIRQATRLATEKFFPTPRLLVESRRVRTPPPGGCARAGRCECESQKKKIAQTRKTKKIAPNLCATGD
jgi:hypothetical protein